LDNSLTPFDYKSEFRFGNGIDSRTLAIILGVIGSFVFIVAIAAVVVFVLFKKRILKLPNNSKNKKVRIASAVISSRSASTSDSQSKTIQCEIKPENNMVPDRPEYYQPASARPEDYINQWPKQIMVNGQPINIEVEIRKIN
jgi:hypothetical protein